MQFHPLHVRFETPQIGGSAECYDDRDGVWREVSPIGKPREHCGTAVMGGYLSASLRNRNPRYFNNIWRQTPQAGFCQVK